MKTTITDPGTQFILEDQLRKDNLTWLELYPVTDYCVQDQQFAVFSATLCSSSSPDVVHGSVFDAWIVTIMGNSGLFNKDNFKSVEDAVGGHLGRLVLEGRLKVVDMVDDSSEEVEENQPPPGFSSL